MRYLRVVSLFSFVLLLAGCGSSGGESSDDSAQETVTQNSAPIISNLAAVIAVPENQTSVVMVEATDDQQGELIYSLTGTDALDFEISNVGLVTFNLTPDYETKNLYSLTVNVSDGELISSQNIIISVTNINEGEASTAEITISSAAFKNTGSLYYNLPLTYTCDGIQGGISPLIEWSGVPEGAASLVLSMHSIASDGSRDAQFTVFNIPASATYLAEGDFSIGIAAQGGMSDAEIEAANGVAYAAPCAQGAGTESHYIFTLYALSQELGLTADTTQAQVLAEIEANAAQLSSQSLITRRVSWDAQSLANNLHVPTSVPSTCEEKTAHFNQYSANMKSITCHEEDNYLGLVSHSASGVRSEQSSQQIQVGITYWIGRITLPGEAAFYTPLRPTFLDTVSNNVPCEGDGSTRLGITVDGVMILPYFNQNIGGAGEYCGPLDMDDGKEYYNADIPLVGGVDQCFGHAGNGDGYHVHGAPVCLMDVHDPSKPLAYMLDGIPLYFGQSGGTLEETPHAQLTKKRVTATNFGAGLYEHLDYRPSDVIDGSNPLNECNAYDINGDGATSGYIYYSTKEAPYGIGCFMGEMLDESVNASGGSHTQVKLISDRGWLEWMEGFTNLEVIIQANYTGLFEGKTYSIYDIYIDDDRVTLLTQGDTAQVLWRILNESDDLHEEGKDCFEFRYRLNKNITDSDRVETVCSSTVLPATTLDLTPFGSN